MPLILTQNPVTASGHDYADVLGESYEYPRRYRNLIVEGEAFAYYRGRRSAAGNRPQVYLGYGSIGTITPVAGGLLRCDVIDYEAFADPVFFKPGGKYLETEAARYGSKAGLYFRVGVRRVTPAVFDRIVELGKAAG